MSDDVADVLDGDRIKISTREVLQSTGSANNSNTGFATGFNPATSLSERRRAFQL